MRSWTVGPMVERRVKKGGFFDRGAGEGSKGRRERDRVKREMTKRRTKASAPIVPFPTPLAAKTLVNCAYRLVGHR